MASKPEEMERFAVAEDTLDRNAALLGMVNLVTISISANSCPTSRQQDPQNTFPWVYLCNRVQTLVTRSCRQPRLHKYRHLRTMNTELVNEASHCRFIALDDALGVVCEQSSELCDQHVENWREKQRTS
jgi:hypothetical protein